MYCKAASRSSRGLFGKPHRSSRQIHQKGVQATIESIKQFNPETAPQKTPLPQILSLLRQKAQSNPSIKQMLSGTRKSSFSKHYLPKDLQIRIKSKTNPLPKTERASADPKVFCIDELETYSRVPGLSWYFPQGADGLFAGLTDLSLQRNIRDIGSVRKDMAEHCSRMLRLRVVSTMHRSGIELARHREIPEALEIPLPGKKSPFDGVSRLDLIRKEVRRRIIAQDSQWLLQSPFIKLSDPVEDNSWKITNILPPAGLQCILKVPEPPTALKLSVSSELDAKTVWKSLMPQSTGSLDFDVLDQSGASWISYMMACAPESGKEPTLSTEALRLLYCHLPSLTSEKLVLHENGATVSKKQARRQRAQLLADRNKEDFQPELLLNSCRAPANIRSQASISYDYSLEGSGSPFAVSQGAESKLVPVYDASAIFGSPVATTVINWLLSNTDSSNSRYIGLVALPCTVDLAAQLDRLSVFLHYGHDNCRKNSA